MKRKHAFYLLPLLVLASCNQETVEAKPFIRKLNLAENTSLIENVLSFDINDKSYSLDLNEVSFYNVWLGNYQIAIINYADIYSLEVSDFDILNLTIWTNALPTLVMIVHVPNDNNLYIVQQELTDTEFEQADIPPGKDEIAASSQLTSIPKYFRTMGNYDDEVVFVDDDNDLLDMPIEEALRYTPIDYSPTLYYPNALNMNCTGYGIGSEWGYFLQTTELIKDDLYVTTYQDFSFEIVKDDGFFTLEIKPERTFLFVTNAFLKLGYRSWNVVMPRQILTVPDNFAVYIESDSSTGAKIDEFEYSIAPNMLTISEDSEAKLNYGNVQPFDFNDANKILNISSDDNCVSEYYSENMKNTTNEGAKFSKELSGNTNYLNLKFESLDSAPRLNIYEDPSYSKIKLNMSLSALDGKQLKKDDYNVHLGFNVKEEILSSGLNCPWAENTSYYVRDALTCCFPC